jgi:hypothetical protein
MEPGAGSGSGHLLADQIRTLPLLGEVSTPHSLKQWYGGSVNAKATTLLLVIQFATAVSASGEPGFDPKYERDYNIFNPAKKFRPNNPLNPVDRFDPNNPFNPVNRFDPNNPANPVNKFNPNNPFNPTNQYNPNNPLNPTNRFNPQTPFEPLR